MHECLIAFGSNEGHSTEILDQTIDALTATQGVWISTCSSPQITPAVGGPKDQPPYLNAVIDIQTTRSPFELHEALVNIETQLGRERRQRWGPRKVDLDLLLFDQLQLNSEKLTIPHPRMSFRRFVLEPAVEIAPNRIHVTSGQTIHQLVGHLNDRENLIVYVTLDPDNDPLGRLGDDFPNHWAFRTIDPQAMGEFESKAKLIAFVGTSLESLESIETCAAKFKGPTLNLPPDPSQARSEIMAAIDAMTPLKS